MATNTFWNGFGMLAQKIQKNREEEALTKALRNALGIDSNGASVDNTKQKQQGNNDYKFDYNSIMGASTGNTGLDKLLSMQGQPQQTVP